MFADGGDGIALIVPLLLLEDIIDHCGSGDEQCSQERTAYEIAYSWYDAAGIPKSVQRVLDTNPLYGGAQMLDGFFERKVALAPGAESQTDLMVVAAVEGGLAMIAVEGKGAEPFGPLVAEWNTGPRGDDRHVGRAAPAPSAGDRVRDPQPARRLAGRARSGGPAAQAGRRRPRRLLLRAQPAVLGRAAPARFSGDLARGPSVVGAR